MTGRQTRPDDARAIPQRDAGGDRRGYDGTEAGTADGVYTVDVRGRRRARSGPGAPDEARDEGPRRRRLPVVRIVLVLVAAWLAFMIFTPLHAWNAVAKVDTTPAGTRPADTKGFNYLLVGSDSRAGLTAAQRRELRTGKAVGRRTDSIILVHVPQDGGKPALISIPRDSYVPIPGHGSNKINAAFAFGGPNLLVQTIEHVTDLHIDGYVEIGFAGFASVVDSVGGVNICVPFHMDDHKAGINLQKGCQVLDGKNALGFVRARYSDPRGDIGRAERQRQFLAAIMKQALTPATVLIPTRYWGFTHAAAQGLIVGQDTSLRDATRVLLAMRAVSKGQGLSLVVPIQSVNYQTSAGDSVKWDTQRAKALFTMLRNDQPLEAPPAGTNGKPSGG
ncbi:LCP family protein required for cell wall assembly [Phycicoccus badiiscoriae]|uniref:LCP family protein required for cell wall assembly n=1 Tax=Pedococcus badiiscoriae TaxID=642776 RepID=A0A852WFT8_9MICO|nr:LCP family protein [Pedococcus badiiscoriae]NYG07629.1 LCP family protein required for cell wall assembly [Pedococcus badiiscoriae]